VELVLWVVFLLAAAALLVSGWRRPGAQLVLAGLAGSFAALLLAYWLSPHDLEWHLLTSADRVIITPVIILVIGVLLTIESAFDRKRRDGGESIGSSRS
jgi:peptidoglycan/LPS O-acetylase OafA/YrhL